MRSLMVEYLLVPLVHLQTTVVFLLLQAMFLIPLNLSTAVVIEVRGEAGDFCPLLAVAVT